jgi:hypothetical protein
MKKMTIKIEKSKPKARGAVALFKKKNGPHHNREYDAAKGRTRKPKYKNDKEAF